MSHQCHTSSTTNTYTSFSVPFQYIPLSISTIKSFAQLLQNAYKIQNGKNPSAPVCYDSHVLQENSERPRRHALTSSPALQILQTRVQLSSQRCAQLAQVGAVW